MKLYEMSMKNMRWGGQIIVCDTESTALHPNDQYGKLIQIAAIKVKADGRTETFDTYVDSELPLLPPRRGHPDEVRRSKLPKKIVELTHITDEDVADAPSITEVIPAFYRFVNDGDPTVMVYHNAPHDISFLHYFASQQGYDFEQMPIIDTASIARKLWTKEEVQDYKLETLAAHFGISDPNHHNAMNDVSVTLKLFQKEKEELRDKWMVAQDMKDRGGLVCYKGKDAPVTVVRASPWTGNGNFKRLYVTVKQDDPHDGLRYATVYYDFKRNTWGQKKTDFDFQVQDYTEIQSVLMSTYGLFDWSWGNVVLACQNHR